uniref:DUF4780 domain-containing protein n=1 Tax=Bactrocera tryoni TaxID=59916 RepID=A0A142LX38_BACRY|nr:hypothetical protein [Bactrocera tryoni]
MPSCSGARLAKVPAAAAAATSAAKTPLSRPSGSDSGESHRAETDGARSRRRRRRRGGQRPLPAAGKPGGCDDPHRKGMSGASMKWYLRYLRDGKTPEEAEASVRGRKEGSNASPAKKRNRAVSARTQGSGTRNRGPVSTTRTARRGDGRAAPTDTYAQTAKRKSGQITPQEPPSSKRMRGGNTRAAGSQPSEPAPHRVEEGRRRYADAVKGIRMAVLPQNYPAELLTSEELTVLQDLLMEEVFRGDEYAASFLGVDFKGGMIQVDCKDERSANWLREFAPKLEGWKGPVLCAKRAEDVPIMHSMTMFLPRCGDKPYEFALGLVKNQNLGLSISAWRVVSSKVEKIGDMIGWRLYLYIDDESYKYVRAASFRLFYRFSTVVMRPHKPAATGSKEADKAATQQSGGIEKQAETVAAPEAERMQVDEVANQPSESRAGQAMPAATIDVPDVSSCGQGAELPSTQELLEGLGDPLDGSAIDGGDEDLPLLEPLL